MITYPCTCGIKPIKHAHFINLQGKEEVLYWKGIPIAMDETNHKTFMLNATKINFPKRRIGELINL